MARTPDMLLHPRQLKPTRSATGRMPGGNLGLNSSSAARIVQQVEKGFSYAAIVNFHKASGLPVGSIAELVRIPQRTLMRRKATGRLRPDESERLLRVARVFEKAVGLFEGDAKSARSWLMKPNDELDHQPPLEFARTEVGAREVEDLIGRLVHGVFT